MKDLIKPEALKRGDKIATISLSWGGAGELLQRYEYGKSSFRRYLGWKLLKLKMTYNLRIGFIITQKHVLKI